MRRRLTSPNFVCRTFFNDKGFSLLASVLAMTGLAVMGVVFASAVTQHQYSAVNEQLSTQAVYIAEAGFELVIQELLDNQDYAFNDAPAGDGVGKITNATVGAGKVSVNCDAVTKVCTATATVGDVQRVVAMTLNVKNLVKRDPIFQDIANLSTNWPEAPPDVTHNDGASGIASNALEAWTLGGSNLKYRNYREQALDYNDALAGDQPVPAKSRVIVRSSYMRDYTGLSSAVNRQDLEIELVYSDGSTASVWLVGPSSVPNADKGQWRTADIRGFSTSATLTTNKVRLNYHFHTSGSANPTDQVFGWLDNIAVSIIDKSAWNEP